MIKNIFYKSLILFFSFFFFSLSFAFSYDFYWEKPVLISSSDSRFPKSVTNEKKSFGFWQEIDSSKKQIWISCIYFDGFQWCVNERFAGPFAYSGEVPDIFSVAINKKNSVVLAIKSSASDVSVYVSNDECRSFEMAKIPNKNESLFAPRIFSTSDNKFILFSSLAKQGENDLLHNFYLYSAKSVDGLSWSDFSEVSAFSSIKNPFAPILCSSNSCEYIVVQGQHQNGKNTTYQLYSSVSRNAGKTWENPVLVTDEKSFEIAENFSEFDNQRPFLYCTNEKTFLSWERRSIYNENSSIWFCELNSLGFLVEKSAFPVVENGNARRSLMFSFDNKLCMTWFDSRKGSESSYFAQYDGVSWEEQKLSEEKKDSFFPCPLIYGERLCFVWQENSSSRNSFKLALLLPDTNVMQSQITSVNYKKGTRTKNSKVRFNIKLPEDSSGIEGFVYSWSQDSSISPEQNRIDVLDEKNGRLSLNATAEGTWYLKVKTLDNAGNWSQDAVFEYILDLTPPSPVVFEEPFERSFKDSNSFTIKWNPSSEDFDISGYTYEIKRINSVDSKFFSVQNSNSISKTALEKYAELLLQKNKQSLEKGANLPSYIRKTIPQVSFKNLKNGIYVFSVAAIDEAGLIGQKTSIPILLNKYVPKTQIFSINAKESVFGNLSFDIYGDDFNFGGTISSIYIDKDGKSPYDLIIDSKSGGFSVVSDQKISSVNAGSELEEGDYFVGVFHTERGLCLSAKPILSVSTNGTVKVDKDFEYVPEWKTSFAYSKYNFNLLSTIVVLLIAICAIFVLAFGISISKNIIEQIKIKRTVSLLEKGELMLSEETERNRKGSLKVSLVGFTISLVVFIIILLSAVLGRTMILTQEKTLSEGLKDRVDVLLSSIATSVKNALPSEDILELSQLPNQLSSLPEAQYLTVTGFLSSESKQTAEKSLLHVWVSDDPNIKSKVDRLNSRRTSFESGVSLLAKQNENEQIAAQSCYELNVLVQQALSSKIKERTKLFNERTSASQTRKTEIDNTLKELDIELKNQLEKYSKDGEGSIPNFSTESLNYNTFDYIFYKPVLFRSNNSSDLVRAIVFIKVNTSSLLESISVARTKVIYIVLITSVLFIAIGCLGAFIYANYIVKPIRRLEKVVKDISEEHDKEKLLGNKIENLPNNEIGRLGDSVNRMQTDLGFNAQELNLQLNASEIQQSLVPLEPLLGNIKQNISSINDSLVQEFAYYKGAAGVSGDYFDCHCLDDRWYSLIKCDASGHAAPAGILVTMVATLYKKYFENWAYSKNGISLDDFVYKVNDFLESLNIKGKFVAMIVCLYDSKTGKLYVCHAGDRILHIYRSSNSRLEKIELPETPAAGPFPSFMVKMKGGYAVHELFLAKNDILLLYTDGIEENGRTMRSIDFSAIKKPKLNDKGEQLSDEYGNLLFENEKEEFGELRVKEIFEAVLAQKKYVLSKEKNPSIGEELVFDFSTCTGTLSDSILALTSLEKVFRFYKFKNTSEKDLVEVDIAIDSFLKEHFNLYSEYANILFEDNEKQIPKKKKENPNYIFYKKLKEDEQEDDLTVIALKRI